MESRRRKRQSKVEAITEEVNVITEVQSETVSSSKQTVETTEEKNQEEQDSQIDNDVEVKGSATVTVSWDKKHDGHKEEDGDSEERTDASDQMMCSEEQIVPSVPETDIKEDTHEPEDSPTDTVTVESKPATVTVTYEEKNEEGADEDITEETDRVAVKGKRKACSTVETSPSKKTKLINDGFCLFVGNLNHANTFENVKNALATFFTTQSVLVQDIRLDKKKKYAHVDLASEMDVTKGLTLDGAKILDKPMRIARANVKSADHVKVKVKATAEEKKAARDAKCLFLKNVPYTATKEDIQKVFRNAVAIRFSASDKGIAFVEFKNDTKAKKAHEKIQAPNLLGRPLIVDRLGQTKEAEVAKANEDDNKTKAPSSPNNTLFVSNLSPSVREKTLKKIFPKAVSIRVPQLKNKSRGYSFLEFATMADAEEALISSKKTKLCSRTLKAYFCEMREKTPVSKNTLIVTGLAAKTTTETLEGAFEGAISARVILDKETGVSKRFGFVEFDSEEMCKAVRQAMEDCEIEGSKITLGYARIKPEKGSPGAKKESPVAKKGPPGAKKVSARQPPKGNTGIKADKGHGTGKKKAVAKKVKNKA